MAFFKVLLFMIFNYSILTSQQELERGTLIRTIGKHERGINIIELLTNGFVATCNEVGTIIIWNPENGQQVNLLTGGHISGVSCNALKSLPNGNLASSAEDTRVIIWNIKDGKIEKLIQNVFGVTAFETLSNGTLVTGGYEGSIRILDDNYSQTRAVRAHDGIIRSLQLLPNGNLASAGSDDTVKIWDTKNNYKLISSKYHYRVYSLDLIGNGNLVSGGWDQYANVWNPVNGNLIGDYNLSIKDINQIRYLQKDVLAVVGASNRFKLFNTLTWRATHEIAANSTSWLTSLELLNDGNLIVGSTDGLLRIYHI